MSKPRQAEALFDTKSASALEMPADYYGVVVLSGGWTITDPRRWTDKEVEWVRDRINEGYTAQEIAEAIGRTVVSVEGKIKRQAKTSNTYNEKHRTKKYEANQQMIDATRPTSVLDLYAGNSFYLNKNIDRVVTNDTDEKFATDHHEDALRLLCRLYADGDSFDIIDLDPYGSAYDCIDLAVKMAKKGIAISFGEWGHRRWRRFDFVRNRYGITQLEEFTEQPFLDELARIAATNRKNIKVQNVLQYGNFLRVHATFEKLMVTEQWGATK